MAMARLGNRQAPHCGLFVGLCRGDVLDDFNGVDGFDIFADLLHFVSLTKSWSMSFPPILFVVDPHSTIIYTGDDHVALGVD